MSRTGHAGRGVATTAVAGPDDVRRFFDRIAHGYGEQHGHAHRLLAYRLGLVRRHAGLRPTDVVLDVGCGPGDHLVALATAIRQGIGVDLSPAMVASARLRSRQAPAADHLAFAVDDAARLATVADASVDLALCIGALEHMPDPAAVVRCIHRTLRPGGRLFCLTPDGAHLWYRRLAPALGWRTKHLSTDTFLDRGGLLAVLTAAGYARVQTGAWTFLPKGDMPAWAAAGLGALAALGGVLGIDRWRGGLWACAWRAG